MVRGILIVKQIDVKVGGTGLTFSGALTILFVALKLCKVIDWSWWWVLAPLWIPAAFVVLVLCIVVIVVSCKKVIHKIIHRH